MHTPSLDPATDFPAECADLYPDGFRYPVGYLPRRERVTDREILESFDPLVRPFIVRGHDGKPAIDHGPPVAIRRLLQAPDPLLSSAIRYLELGGSPDDAMQATYRCEDLAAHAETLSQAGHHAQAIATVRALPPPFQVIAPALRALVDSLKALGSWAEALEEVRRLIRDDTITEYARELARIEEANLLVLLGRRAVAERLLSAGGDAFRGHFTYYGVRAALALRRKDEALARQLIARAGRVEPMHARNLLWESALRPLAAFIRGELLDADDEPKLYRQNTEIRQVCHRVQGALLTGDRAAAAMLMEAALLSRINDWTCAHEAVLCLIGLGAFRSAAAMCTTLPGSRMETMQLARTIALSHEFPGLFPAEEIARLFHASGCEAGNREHFAKVAELVASGRISEAPDVAETPLADIGGRWGADGRERIRVVCERQAGFRAYECQETRGPRGHRAEDPRLRHAVTRTFDFGSAKEAALWLEEKLRENAELPQTPFRSKRWDIHLNGWGCLTKLQPKRAQTPLLAKAWALMRRDPNLYFTNGPAQSYALPVGFAERLGQMLAIGCR